MYIPNNWVIIKFSFTEEVFYKVLGGWSGGYLDPDNWRMNSGITKVEEKEEYFLFHGYSGSIYKCYKDSESVRMNCAGILSEIKRKYPNNVKKIPYKEFIKEFKPLKPLSG